MKTVALVIFIIGIFEAFTGIYILVTGGNDYNTNFLFAVLYLIAGLLALIANKLYIVTSHITKGEQG